MKFSFKNEKIWCYTNEIIHFGLFLQWFDAYSKKGSFLAIITIYYHSLSENRDFSGTEPPLDLRPVFKLKFVRCGPGEKNRALHLSWFYCGGPTKLKNTFFQIAKLRFLSIFEKNFPNFQKNLRGPVYKLGASNFGFYPFIYISKPL